MQNLQIEQLRANSADLQNLDAVRLQKLKELQRTIDGLRKKEEIKVQKQETKENNLYELTVQLGAITEENNELKLDLKQ